MPLWCLPNHAICSNFHSLDPTSHGDHRACFPRWPPSVLSFPRWDPEGPPHPLLHTGIFLINGSKDSLAMNYCTFLCSALRGRFIDFLCIIVHFISKKVKRTYFLRFRLDSALSHGGTPFSVAAGSPAGLSHAGHLPLIVSHAGTWRDPPPPPPPYWDPPFTNRKVVLRSSMLYAAVVRAIQCRRQGINQICP